MSNMIALQGVSKKYDEETYIKLKDFEFQQEKSYCILGPSGSGKSTLLNMIAGIVKPSEGKVVVDGTYLGGLSQKEMDELRYNKIGYITQNLNLFDEFTVKDNLGLLELGGKLTYNPLDVLGWVGISHKLKAKVKTLSGGERQRVAIARALLKAPKVMLCDEPTGSLNTAKGIEIMELLISLHKEQKNTLIVVTHDDRLTKYFDVVIPFEDMLGGGENA